MITFILIVICTIQALSLAFGILFLIRKLLDRIDPPQPLLGVATPPEYMEKQIND